MNWLKALLGKSADKQAAESSSAPQQVDEQTEIQLREGSPEYDYFIASQTLELDENLAHGASHLANLLSIDPAHKGWQALLERYIHAAQPDVEQTLLPDEGSRYANTEALRAYLWQTQGRTVEAVSLLLEVTRVINKTNYLDAWGLAWLEADGVAESLPEQNGLMLLGTVLTHHGEAHTLSVRGLSNIRRWARLAQRMIPRYARSGVMIMAQAGLYRKAGLFEDALAVTGPLEGTHEFSHAVAIGLIMRRKGDPAAAAEAFARAMEFEPDNETGHREAGDNWFDAKAWDKALVQYEAALRLQPGNPWAQVSSWYCQWKLDGSQRWMELIRDAANEGDNYRANALLSMTYGAMDESGDATANILRQIRKQMEDKPPAPSEKPGKVSLTLSTLEAPSNRLAMALDMACFKQNLLLEVAVQGIPKIDPRQAMTEISYPLWRYEGTDPFPALPAPSSEVAERIATLASETYEPELNWAQASHVAADLGPGKVSEILAVMIYPPAVPAGMHALAWLPRVQLSAAQVLAQIDTGWEGSNRREALLSILYGPQDWVTCAAIRALAWIARVEPVYALSIHESFAFLEKYVSSEGHWDWIQVLYEEWQTIPYLFEHEREALRKKRADLLENDGNAQ